MKGVYAGRGADFGRLYLPTSSDLWFPKRAEIAHHRWPPRTIRRALPIAQRSIDSRARRRAHQRIVRAAARLGIKVTVTR